MAESNNVPNSTQPEPANQQQATANALNAAEQTKQKEIKKVEEFSLMWHLRVLGVIYLVLIVFYVILKVTLK
jgi:hypothetical protein